MDRQALQDFILKAGAAHFEYFETIGSTNDAAREWLQSGNGGVFVAFAEEQSTGRGRQDREWQSPKGSSISLSLGFSKGILREEILSILAGTAGIACAKALQAQCGLAIELKWPNDLLLENKKVGGILVESDWEGNENVASVIGIGINVGAAALEQGGMFAFPATFLEAHSKQEVDKLLLVGEISKTLIAMIHEGKKGEMLEDWNQGLWRKGEWVRFQESEQESFMGQIQRVDESGRIVLKLGTGDVRHYAAGEIRMPSGNVEKGA